MVAPDQFAGSCQAINQPVVYVQGDPASGCIALVYWQIDKYARFVSVSMIHCEISVSSSRCCWLLGTANVDRSGHATLTVSNLSTGAYDVTAVYSGDNFYSTSAAALLHLVFNQQVFLPLAVK
jgi:hypothetical protein